MQSTCGGQTTIEIENLEQFEQYIESQDLRGVFHELLCD